MDESWIAGLTTLSHTRQIDTIVQIGAGDGAALEVLLDLPAQRIALVEPDPEAAMELRALTRHDPRVEVLDLAVGGESGSGTLYRQSLPGLSAIVPARGLHGLFPGLYETARLPVEVLDLADLLARLELGAPAPGSVHVLRLDAPGSETAILNQLAAQAPHFAHVSLRIAAEGLYDTGLPAPDPALWDALDAAGYTREDRTDEDPDFLGCWLHFDPRRREIADLRQTLADLRATHADLQALFENLRAENTSLHDQVAEASAAQRAEAARRQDEIEEARKDARLAMRLQALAAADLADLRERHAALTGERQQQDALLAQVAACLERALGAPAEEARPDSEEGDGP